MKDAIHPVIQHNSFTNLPTSETIHTPWADRTTDQVLKLGVEILLDGEPGVRNSLVKISVEITDHLHTHTFSTCDAHFLAAYFAEVV